MVQVIEPYAAADDEAAALEPLDGHVVLAAQV
jgi:hypothetical protein